MLQSGLPTNGIKESQVCQVTVDSGNLTAVWPAIPTANGKARAAAALFPIVAANMVVMRYTPTSMVCLQVILL